MKVSETVNRILQATEELGEQLEEIGRKDAQKGIKPRWGAVYEAILSAMGEDDERAREYARDTAEYLYSFYQRGYREGGVANEEWDPCARLL